ncbi:MAG: 5'/3'-nucleotidase SurE [Anaerolineales bacterium]|nr:5'/3'-nucleotidase SurE [Anaerolineae bacterium]PWB69880.1 MAG: 5'/3'-nucleotidase SurE [Anaerolineales bacterium]
MAKPQILLTNDDGIRSPGLWAAAASLSDLGFVTVTAPREQSSGMGRSLPNTSDGTIQEQRVQVNGREWSVFAVGGSPAQSVLHGVLEVLKFKPDLVVSGINYGENVASGVTISGTVGAAMEAASLGIPAMAVSLEADQKYHLSYSNDVNFLIAAEFAKRFAHLLLDRKFPQDVSLLKVDVPWDATLETPWQLTRVSRQRYYEPVAPVRTSWSEPGTVGYREAGRLEEEAENTDVYVLRKKRWVSVTPLSLDLTARVDFAELDDLMRKG